MMAMKHHSKSNIVLLAAGKPDYGNSSDLTCIQIVSQLEFAG